MPHGMAVSLTAPEAFRFTFPASPERHRRAAELLAPDLDRPGDDAEYLPAALVAVMRDVGRITRVAKGAGRPPGHVVEVLNKYDTMRRMMIALGDQPSLLAKLPGFEQVAQVRKLRGLDLAELFGDAFELPRDEPEEEEDDDALEENARAARERREYFANLAKAPAPKKQDKSKEKKKKKEAAKARRRNRR